MRFRIDLSYDGTDFNGWQKQNGQDCKTIQGEFEKALKKLSGIDINTLGSGRTDAGVHALQQTSHFDLPDDFNYKNFDWVRGLNRYLPDAIRAQTFLAVPNEFHAIKSALSKTYEYHIQDDPVANPLYSRYALWVPTKLDHDYLNELSKVFLGEHDFSSFQTSGTELATTVRTLHRFDWKRCENGRVLAEIEGSGFLKQMVRNLIGCLLHQYWKKSLSKSQIKEILMAKSRSAAFGTAPACGLCLKSVKYP